MLEPATHRADEGELSFAQEASARSEKMMSSFDPFKIRLFTRVMTDDRRKLTTGASVCLLYHCTRKKIVTGDGASMGVWGKAMSEQVNVIEVLSAQKRAQDSKASLTPILPHSHTLTLSCASSPLDSPTAVRDGLFSARTQEGRVCE